MLQNVHTRKGGDCTVNATSGLIFSLNPVQTDATLLDVACCVRFAHPIACCWMLLRVVAQSLKPVKLFSQQLPTYLSFRDRQSVAQQCWIRLHNSSNIVGATHAHYAWFTKTYGLYPSHDALQVPTLLGVVASVCTQPYPQKKGSLHLTDSRYTTLAFRHFSGS